MTCEKTAEYVKICRAMREKYAGKINVLCGIEQDLYAPKQQFECDYIIGSVHYIYIDGEYISVDDDIETLIYAADKYFVGDIYAVVEKYYATVEKVKSVTKCDIIGHFDLISKFAEKYPKVIDTENERYTAAAERALERILAEYPQAVFEMNSASGAVAKGYRKAPYPSERLLRKIRALGGRITFSSDCHNKDLLDFGFDEMKECAKRVGFTSATVYFDGEFCEKAL